MLRSLLNATTGSCNRCNQGNKQATRLADITSVSARETYDGKIELAGSEKFTVAETAAGAYAGLGLSADAAGHDNHLAVIAKTYDYQGLANYAVGDVVSGTRDGSSETYLVTGPSPVLESPLIHLLRVQM